MNFFDLLQTEISRHNWAGMTCGCLGSAEHIPRDFLRSLGGPPPEDTGEGWADDHAFVQSNLMQPAVATASMVMAALAAGAPHEHRHQLMSVLHTLVHGEQDDIAEACLDLVRGGSWILYEEICSGRSIEAASYAYEMLELFPEEDARLNSVRRAARENLSYDLR